MTPRQPLLIHLVFHPGSSEARKIAADIHCALNTDPTLPGLRIPTVNLAEDGSSLPPLNHELNEAERNVVVVLADDHMVVEPLDLPSGRQLWTSFVGDLWAHCQHTKQRFIPVQLSESAWPLDQRLSLTNFIRVQDQPEALRTKSIIRRLMVELCRFLQGLTHGESLPLRLFLSHAKQDIPTQPQVFEAISEHLDNTKPIETWIDSAKIEGGSQFSDAIENGVKDSALMIIRTNSYSSRTWCRKELLLAKRHQRPLVIIDAVEGLEQRSFPYAGNVPKMRWVDGGAEAAVDLLLKETLRHTHVKMLLASQKLPGDVVLPSPPELATVLRIPKGTRVLYPDPPLGDEEMEELNEHGLILETPLQRAAQGSSLKGKTVILSISEAGDSERYGLTSAHLDAALIETTLQFLVRGASLEYGGHLGSKGYTTALFNMARAYNSLSGLPPAEKIINDVGWPLPLASLPPAERARNQCLARYRRIPRPDGVEALDPLTFIEEPTFFPADSPERRYAWARGMTAMREFQSTKSGAIARIVFGGKVGPTITSHADGSRKEAWYSGRIPGVVEECIASIRAGQPLFLIGAFGGAARLVIDLLEGRERPDFTWEYQRQAPHADATKDRYLREGQVWEDYDDMTTFLSKLGCRGLASLNGLTEAENRELFVSRCTGRYLDLIITGINRLAAY